MLFASGAESRRSGRRRAFSIARKLTLAMTLPLLIAIVVLGLEIVDIEREGREVRQQAALAVSADGPSRLLIGLQDEQAWATVELIGLDAEAGLLVEGYDETRRRTDEALVGFEGFLGDGPQATRRAFAPAMASLRTDLEALRRQIDGYPEPHILLHLPLSEDVFDRYNELVRPFFAGIEQVASAVERADLRQGAELVELTGRQVTTLGSLGREVGFAALFNGGIDRRDDIVEASALRSRFVRLAAAIRSRSTGMYAEAGDDRLFVDYTDAVAGQVDAAIEGRFDGQAFLETLAQPPGGSYQAYRERVAAELRDRADSLSAAAARRERIYVAAVVLTGALASVTVVVVARSMTRPLRSLAEHVRHTAHRGLRQAVATVLGTPMGEDVAVPELPEVTVAGRGEVGEVATVMNTVQRAVVRLAVEQVVLRRNLTDSLVSLGRRNQNLLSRQIAFITELQRNEADPDVLAQLFELDHLATRMRRNAESLLVLAGGESPRTWLAPVGVVDIVRAAVGEVESYQRIALTVVEPFTIRGHVAADLAHLLAELLENALLFSPPDQLVEVRGLIRPAGYTIAIVDRGLGMPPSEIARANRRLAGTESFTVAPSRYLGHYVAANLAARHGVRVRLHRSIGSGITAVVQLSSWISATRGRDPLAGATSGSVWQAVGALPDPPRAGGHRPWRMSDESSTS